MFLHYIYLGPNFIIHLQIIFLFYFFIVFFYFLERERGKERAVRKREKERERNINVGEKHLLVAFHRHPSQGLNLQPRHLRGHVTGNQTRDLSVCRMMSNQLSHTGQGCKLFFLLNILFERIIYLDGCSSFIVTDVKITKST